MAKQFNSIVELTRTFVRTGVWLAGRDWERKAQYLRLDKGLGAWQDPKPRMRKYNAYLWPYSTALGPKIHGQLVPIVIQHAWDTQDYARFATPWELKWSTLCQDFTGTRGTPVSVSGVGRLFEPVVEDTGDFDVMVVGYVGVVNGTNLLVPASLALRAGGDPIGAKMRGIAVFVAQEHFTVHPPEGWKRVGASDTTYQVQTALDGRVVLIRGWTDRGPESANWVIDAAVEIALTAGTIKLAKYGMRTGRSLFNIAGKPVGKAPILAGPTKELAEEEVLAALSADRAAGRAMSGAGARATGTMSAAEMPVARSQGRTLILGDDLNQKLPHINSTPPQPGMHDVWVHGETSHFFVYDNGIKKIVSVDDVAAAIRPSLRPGDSIRLVSCEVGCTGGPAQQLADRLVGHKVWAPTTEVAAAPKTFEGGARVFVPDLGGKYYPFEAQRRVNAHVIRRGAVEPP